MRAHAETNRACCRPERIVRRGLRQTKQDHRSVAQVACDYSAAGHCLLVDQSMKVLQQLTYPMGSKPLAKGCESRQIDENDRCILTNRFGKKVGIPCQPFLNGRSRKLFEQLTPRGKIMCTRLPNQN